ncbi:MAG TPA: peptide deformylase [Methylomusa anaerophila]|uniref:Peptide deformylase n=1 Tax=Methylomusa anaerophila TaxID=1930071 RepID=A0A348APN0_9FIRM|nr:peptide deformylase [Methylomusa anaerophila]BBB93028.1 peptide deformylase 1 [Methylomusa anaerophila]HML87138.1 peptide deformylase [Methylomusa anaerophila]
MAIMDIKKAGDSVLKNVSAPVGKIDKKIKQLLDDMGKTMYEADGVGLAAPQVGISLRLIVIDVGEGILELINPEILEYEGSNLGTEGCLSIPGMYGEVERYAKVTVEALDRSGKKVRISGDGLLARALQHEIDHLNGILFIERAKSVFKEKDKEQS